MFFIPSYYAHILNGGLLLLALIVIIYNFSKIRKLGTYQLIIFLFIFSIAVGIHGISHLGLEKTYNYNPIQYF